MSREQSPPAEFSGAKMPSFSEDQVDAGGGGWTGPVLRRRTQEAPRTISWGGEAALAGGGYVSDEGRSFWGVTEWSRTIRHPGW